VATNMATARDFAAISAWHRAASDTATSIADADMARWWRTEERASDAFGALAACGRNLLGNNFAFNTRCVVRRSHLQW